MRVKQIFHIATVVSTLLFTFCCEAQKNKKDYPESALEDKSKGDLCMVGKPVEEFCDGYDNDCDGVVDNVEGRGDFCIALRGKGECSKGTLICDKSANNLTCMEGSPTEEICDGRDNDCDGVVDNVEGSGDFCISLGGNTECTRGIFVCGISGDLVCEKNKPTKEICDGLDNDCDGVVDNTEKVGDSCNIAGKFGICSEGIWACDKWEKSLVCVGNKPGSELCDGLDNDCDGMIDEEGSGCEQEECMTVAGGMCNSNDDCSVGVCIEGECQYLCDVSVYENDPYWEIYNDYTDQCSYDRNCEFIPGNCPDKSARMQFESENVATYSHRESWIRAEWQDGELVSVDCGEDSGGSAYCSFDSERIRLHYSEVTASYIDRYYYFDHKGYLLDYDSSYTPRGAGPDPWGASGSSEGRYRYSFGNIISYEQINEEGNEVDSEYRYYYHYDNYCPTPCTVTDELGECGKGFRIYDEVQHIMVCIATEPGSEICDGLDNDCDGILDNVEGVGDACSIYGLIGECANGILRCDDELNPVCVGPGPEAELCDGLDNDCDGEIDNCIIAGESGECATGTLQCDDRSGGVFCAGPVPEEEFCDGLDNDCDGEIDNGFNSECCMLESGIDMACDSNADCSAGFCISGACQFLCDVSVTNNYRCETADGDPCSTPREPHDPYTDLCSYGVQCTLEPYGACQVPISFDSRGRISNITYGTYGELTVDYTYDGPEMIMNLEQFISDSWLEVRWLNGHPESVRCGPHDYWTEMECRITNSGEIYFSVERNHGLDQTVTSYSFDGEGYLSEIDKTEYEYDWPVYYNSTSFYYNSGNLSRITDSDNYNRHGESDRYDTNIYDYNYDFSCY